MAECVYVTMHTFPHMLQIMSRLTTKSSEVYIPCEQLLRCLGDHGKKISVHVLNTDAAFLGISWCPLSHFNICRDFNSVLEKTTRTQEGILQPGAEEISFVFLRGAHAGDA